LDHAIGDLLRIPPRGADGRKDLLGDFVPGAVSRGSRRVGGVVRFLENGRGESARFDNDRIDAFRSKFITLGFGQGFQGELARAVEAQPRQGDPASAAADVDQKAASPETHVGQNGAVHADGAKEISV